MTCLFCIHWIGIKVFQDFNIEGNELINFHHAISEYHLLHTQCRPSRIKLNLLLKVKQKQKQ